MRYIIIWYILKTCKWFFQADVLLTFPEDSVEVTEQMDQYKKKKEIEVSINYAKRNLWLNPKSLKLRTMSVTLNTGCIAV